MIHIVKGFGVVNKAEVDVRTGLKFLKPTFYSYLFQNFPEFIVIHTVKGFGIVNKAEIDVFLELSCFFDDPANIGNSGTW